MTHKTVVITGGTRGIGKALVEKFHEENYNIAFTYHSSSSAAADLEEKLNKNGQGRVKGFEADVSDFQLAKQTVTEIKEIFDDIDILINNAGITQDKPLLLMNLEEWKSVIDTNLTGTFNYSRAVIYDMMKKKRGQILNITSISGIRGLPGQSNYSAAKAGIIGFTKSVAKEVAKYGLMVNALAPGYIETDMTREIIPKNEEMIKKEIPMGRVGTVREVANMAFFIVAIASSYCTGKVFEIDGGMI